MKNKTTVVQFTSNQLSPNEFFFLNKLVNTILYLYYCYEGSASLTQILYT
jgi:hypothetical protein